MSWWTKVLLTTSSVEDLGDSAHPDQWVAIDFINEWLQGFNRQDGETHTNTIEGFWALVKRAWYGQHHRYSRKYMPLYIGEAAYKYNHRGIKEGFNLALGKMVYA